MVVFDGNGESCKVSIVVWLRFSKVELGDVIVVV